MTFADFLPSALFWVGTIADVGLASLICWIGIRLGPRGEAGSVHVGLVTTTLFAILLVKLGGFIQPNLFQLFFSSLPGDFSQGPIYQIEFRPSSFFGSFFEIIFGPTGVVPGAIIALLICRISYGRSPMGAMACAVAVLVLDDCLATMGTLLKYGMSFSNTGNALRYSILCDIVGGPILGLICLWVSRRIWGVVKGLTIASSLRVISRAACISLFVIIFVLIAAYAVFVHPVSDDISSNLSKLRDTGFRNAFVGGWLMPLPGIEIRGPMVVTFKANVNSTAGIKLLLVQGCANEDAVQGATDHGKSDYALELTGKDLSIHSVGLTSTLEFPSARQGSVFFSIVPGTNVSIQRRQDQMPGQLFSLWGAANYVAKFNLALSAITNVEMNATFLGSGDAWAIGSDDGPLKRIIPHAPIPDDRKCRAIPFELVGSDSVPGSGPNNSSFERTTLIAFPEDDPKTATVQISMQSASALSANPDLHQQVVSDFHTKAADGAISVGTEKYERVSTLFVAGSGLRTDLSGNDEVRLSGTSNYVLVNGHLVSKGIFWHLSEAWQIALLSALVTAPFSFVPTLREKVARWIIGNPK